MYKLMQRSHLQTPQKIFFLCLIYIFTFSVFLVSPASALSGSQFNKSRIIDDPKFYRTSSISASSIQSFLNSKMPNCDTNGEQMYNGSQTRAQYGRSKGYPPPYTCLKSYKVNTPSRAGASGLCNSLSAKTNRTAAQIIYDVSKACGIDSKVLIVMLQKEQALVTDDWPWSKQYKIAMGYGCPDDGSCNSTYYGFFNQVYNAARQLKNYRKNPGSFNYASGRTSFVAYQANAPSCSGTNIKMQNAATAALYNYTPYQPNAAALNNLYGTGNSCSAYGNRNFWRMYNDWFGSTYSTPFFRIGSNDAIYMLGANDDYYHITSYKVLRAYGYGSTIKTVRSVSSSYISGRTNSGELPIAARFGGDAVYLVDKGKAHHFSSAELMDDYGFDIGEDEARLPSDTKAYFPTSTPMEEIAIESGGSPVYVFTNAKKRHIVDQASYNSGSPAYSSRDKVSLSKEFISGISWGAPLISNNKLLKRSDNGTYAFWNGSTLQEFNKNTVAELGLTPDYSSATSAINQLTNSSSPSVNKYAKSSGGLLYLLDNKQKFLVSVSDLSELDLTALSFTTTSDSILNKVPTKNFKRVLRVNGSDAIYLVEDGTKKHFSSVAAITEKGFSTSDIINVNTRSSNLFPADGDIVLASGKFFRLDNTSAIWFINRQGERVHVQNKNIITEYGTPFKSVPSFSSQQVQDYVDVGDMSSSYVRDGSSNIWLVHSVGTKRSVSSTTANSTNYNISAGSLPVVSNTVLSKYTSKPALGVVIKSSSNDRIYKVESGQKRWVDSWQKLIDQGYDKSDVVVVSGNFVLSLPSGPNL